MKASSCCSEGRVAAESSPEVAHGGKMDGRRVMLSRSLVAVTAGLRTSNGEMISVSTSGGSKICQ